MPGCVCGTEGGRSSTWTGDHVRHSFVEFSRNNRDYRRKRQGSARSSSSQGTGVSEKVRSTATTVPVGLRVQGAVTFVLLLFS